MSENMISKIKIGNIEYELGTTIDNVDGLQNVLDEKVTENFVLNKIAEARLDGSDVDLSGYATKDDIPTKTSQLTNDSGYLTEEDKTDIAELAAGMIDIAEPEAEVLYVDIISMPNNEYRSSSTYSEIKTHLNNGGVAIGRYSGIYLPIYEVGLNYISFLDSNPGSKLETIYRVYDDGTSVISYYHNHNGEYLTAVPDGYATEEFVATKISEIEFGDGITKEELKDVIDEYFEENPVSSSNNSIFASDDDNGNVTITVVGFSVSDDDTGNITIS